MGGYVSIPTYIETLDQRYKLVAKKCTSCDTLNFPPRDMCKRCGGTSFVEHRLSGRGEVYTYTIIGRGGAPAEFAEQQNMTGAYAVAIVALEEGPRVVAQLTDCELGDVRIGMKVECVIRRIYEQEDIIRYGYKFRPLEPSSSEG